MSLKQQIINDLDLFLNDEEFADLITIDGQEFKVIIDTDSGYQDSYVDIVLTCKFSEFKDFEKGKEIIVDFISYKIHNKSPNMNGTMEVALAKN